MTTSVASASIDPTISTPSEVRRRNMRSRGGGVTAVMPTVQGRRRATGPMTTILPEAEFADVLSREWRRVERSDSVVGLVRVEAEARCRQLDASERDQFWSTLIRSTLAALGPGVALGWIRSGSELGALIPPAALRPGTGLPDGLPQPEDYPGITFICEVWQSRARHASDVLHAGNARTKRAVPTDRFGYSLKRPLDIVGSLFALIVTSPLTALIAILLKLTSPGPLLFRQTRIGEHGRPFTMLKFRTMRVDADPAVHQEYVTRFIRSGAQLHAKSRTVLEKLTNDPRITPVGRLLRRSSLDELPQLWNVLRGDMSLVGPRPPLPYEVSQYRSWHWRRVLDAKPGLTGLWQVVGRSRTTFDEMVRLDIAYARRCSLWADIRILLATPRAVVSGKGAS